MKQNICYLLMTFLSLFAACFLFYAEEIGARHPDSILLLSVASIVAVLGSFALKASSRS
ncbi:MAG: hypothetical protein J6L76_01600 [Clostridia bacterium]|nr:hypothetical protein [Clostridia bacterium]